MALMAKFDSIVLKEECSQPYVIEDYHKDHICIETIPELPLTIETIHELPLPIESIHELPLPIPENPQEVLISEEAVIEPTLGIPQKKQKKRKKTTVTNLPYSVGYDTEFPVLVESQKQEIVDDLKEEFTPTYADIARKIPDHIKHSKQSQQIAHWCKMNVPNITGIYASKEVICAMCLYAWKTFLRRPDQEIISPEFFQFQNMMLERYDFLKRKDIEQEFKKPNTKYKKKKKK